MPKKRPIRKIQVKDANSDTLTELELSDDDLMLVNAYFDVNMNQTRAYLKLHPQTPYDSARTLASQLFARVNIKAEISRRIDEGAMSKNEILYRLGEIARGSHYPFIRVDSDGFVYFNFADEQALANIHLIKKIKTKRERRIDSEDKTWEGEWVEVELYDQMRAQELIGKYHKMFTDKDIQNTDDIKTPFSIPAELIAPDFLSVHRAILSEKYREFGLYGGRGSTKSTFTAEEIVAGLENDPNAHALGMRQVADTLRISVFDTFIFAIDRLGLSNKYKSTTNPLEITRISTGQKIYMRGADDPLKLKSFRPPFGYLKYLWFEELPEFHGEEVIRSITQSAIRGTDVAFIFKTWNPPRTSGNFVNKSVLIPKDGRYLHKSDYRNVPVEWLGKVFLEEAEHLEKTNPSAYAHEYLGEVNGLGDQVFENLEVREITDKEISQFDNVLHGLDFGYYPHPAHFAKVHYDATQHILYVFGEVRKWKHGNKAMYDAIVKSGLYNNTDMLICDSAEPKSVDDYRAYGARARGAEKGAKSVSYSIKWMQSLNKIVLDPVRVPYSTEELTDYAYFRTKDGEIIEDYPREKDDALAAIRYSTNLIWRSRGK